MSPALRHLSNPNSLSSVPGLSALPAWPGHAGARRLDVRRAAAAAFRSSAKFPGCFPSRARRWRNGADASDLLTQHLATEATAMRASLAARRLAGGTRRRLEHVATANEDQIQRLRALLAPLGLDQAGIAEATHRGLGTRLPTEQGLTNYYVNLHRDWAWGEEENQAALQRAARVARR